MKAKAKTRADSVRFFPANASEGDRLLVRFAKPVRGLAAPKVLIGGKPLQAPLLRDRFTLIGHVPADKPGKKQVSVEGKGRAALAAKDALVHKGRRPEKRGEQAWRRILHYKLKEGGRVSPFAGGKPGDPTRPGSNWWMSGADLYRDSNGHSIVDTPLTDVWQISATAPDTFNYAEPVLSEDTLILAPSTSSGEGEYLVAVDSATGQRRWAWEAPSGGFGRVDSSPLCVNGLVYLVKLIREAGDGAIRLLCVDPANGSIVWERPFGSPGYNGYVRLAAAYGLIYTATPQGSLHAFDAVTGAVVWEHMGQVPTNPGFASDQSIAVAYGHLFIGSSNGLRAFDPETGRLVWVSAVAFDCSYSPIVAITGANPPLVIAGDTTGMIHAFNVFTLLHEWQFQGEYEVEFFWPRMACDLERLYLLAQRKVVALHLATGQVQATSPILGEWTSGAPTVCANRLFQFGYRSTPTGSSQLFALDPANIASILEQVSMHSTFAIARPVLEGQRLYLNVTNEDGPHTYLTVIKAMRVRAGP